MERKTGCFAWVVIVVAVATLFLSWQYWRYRLATRTLPAGMKLAGLSVEDMTQAQALNALEVAFATPLPITYQDQVLSLFPSAVELDYDADQTAANLEAALTEWRGVNGFIAFVLRREPDPTSVPVAVNYSGELLTRFLHRIADQHDRPPQAPVALPASLDFRPSRQGSTLKIDASRARLADALVSASRESVDLVVEVEKASGKDITLLDQLLRSRLEGHAGLVPGVFVKDLETGDELAINGQVAYAGLSVLKIAVLEEVYRSLDAPPGAETSKLIKETMAESGNFTANLLLRDVIGDGDARQAVTELTASMKQLGLVNTYMAAPYDEKDFASNIVTPANSREDISTDPDPFMQTTPLDIGLLLEMIYQCSHGGGTLIMTYPDSLSAEECREMLKWMRQNRIDSLIEAGVPAGTQIAHKHGWTSDTHADAGLVSSPGGDYVLVVFLHRPQWLEWEESAPLITDISTAAYNYFNPSP